ncbi:hypothetical protein EDC01DRAFT_635683 [Geopyxis carbonaria]|nr:hypothetical protein EDC01DRAFT_635683 [Geopyxis carbonaria]
MKKQRVPKYSIRGNSSGYTQAGDAPESFPNYQPPPLEKEISTDSMDPADLAEYLRLNADKCRNCVEHKISELGLRSATCNHEFCWPCLQKYLPDDYATSDDAVPEKEKKDFAEAMVRNSAICPICFQRLTKVTYVGRDAQYMAHEYLDRWGLLKDSSTSSAEKKENKKAKKLVEVAVEQPKQGEPRQSSAYKSVKPDLKPLDKKKKDDCVVQ